MSFSLFINRGGETWDLRKHRRKNANVGKKRGTISRAILGDSYHSGKRRHRQVRGLRWGGVRTGEDKEGSNIEHEHQTRGE